MTRKVCNFLLISVLSLSFLFAQDDDISTPRRGITTRRGNSAAAGAFNATAISMMGWGLGLTAVIVVVASVVKTSKAESGSSSGGGGSSHSTHTH